MPRVSSCRLSQISRGLYCSWLQGTKLSVYHPPFSSLGYWEALLDKMGIEAAWQSKRKSHSFQNHVKVKGKTKKQQQLLVSCVSSEGITLHCTNTELMQEKTSERGKNCLCDLREKPFFILLMCLLVKIHSCHAK